MFLLEVIFHLYTCFLVGVQGKEVRGIYSQQRQTTKKYFKASFFFIIPALHLSEPLCCGGSNPMSAISQFSVHRTFYYLEMNTLPLSYLLDFPT